MGQSLSQNSTEAASGKQVIIEMAQLLALAYMRKRLRAFRKESARPAENSLDDVAPRAMVRTGERRTTEKRVDQP
jgi:hypothetical protein